MIDKIAAHFGNASQVFGIRRGIGQGDDERISIANEAGRTGSFSLGESEDNSIGCVGEGQRQDNGGHRDGPSSAREQDYPSAISFGDTVQRVQHMRQCTLHYDLQSYGMSAQKRFFEPERQEATKEDGPFVQRTH